MLTSDEMRDGVLALRQMVADLEQYEWRRGPVEISLLRKLFTLLSPITEENVGTVKERATKRAQRMEALSILLERQVVSALGLTIGEAGALAEWIEHTPIIATTVIRGLMQYDSARAFVLSFSKPKKERRPWDYSKTNGIG